MGLLPRGLRAGIRRAGLPWVSQDVLCDMQHTCDLRSATMHPTVPHASLYCPSLRPRTSSLTWGAMPSVPDSS